MKPDFLKSIQIGKILREETEKRRLTKKILAERMKLKVWVIRDSFKLENIKINRLIAFSYAIGVDFLQVYLQKMPPFPNTKHFEDEVTIEINNGQFSITPSKRSRTADFTKYIHIGKILKAEAKKQQIIDLLPQIFCCSQSAINRMFNSPDIDMVRLVEMSYLLTSTLFKSKFHNTLYMSMIRSLGHPFWVSQRKIALFLPHVYT